MKHSSFRPLSFMIVGTICLFIMTFLVGGSAHAAIKTSNIPQSAAVQGNGCVATLVSVHCNNNTLICAPYDDDSSHFYCTDPNGVHRVDGCSFNGFFAEGADSSRAYGSDVHMNCPDGKKQASTEDPGQYVMGEIPTSDSSILANNSPGQCPQTDQNQGCYDANGISCISASFDEAGNCLSTTLAANNTTSACSQVAADGTCMDNSTQDNQGQTG